MKKTIKEIDVNDLLLDSENARYGGDVAENQREAISKLLQIKDMGKKVLKLAAHIAENGLDPTELPLVIPLPSRKGVRTQYIVTEGNRRTLAIKLLHNPNLAPNDAYRKKFEQITSLAIKRSVSKVQCSVVLTREAADQWVYIKHTGQNDGVGRVDWDGKAKDAYRARTGKKKSAGRQILDYIEADKSFSSEIKRDLVNVDITNISRLFQGSPAKKAFGLVQKNGFLESETPLDEFRTIVEHVLELMLDKDFKVKNIYHKADQEKFIQNSVPKDILPLHENRLEKNQTWKISHLDASSLTKEQKQGVVPKAKVRTKNKGTVRSKAQSKNRIRLIDFPLKINDKRCNHIYGELRNDLSVHDCPNAVSVLFRVFLELTCDLYIEKHKLHRNDNRKPLTRDDKLRIKVEHIANDLEAAEVLSKHQAAAIRKSSSLKNELVSVDSLNKYIHASELSPIPTELNTLMDNWGPFFKAIWK